MGVLIACVSGAVLLIGIGEIVALTIIGVRSARNRRRSI